MRRNRPARFMAARKIPVGLRRRITAGDPLVQPGTGVGPVAMGRDPRDLEDLRGLLDGHAAEVAQGDEPSLPRVVPPKLLEGIVQREQFFRFHASGGSDSRVPGRESHWTSYVMHHITGPMRLTP